MNRSSRTSRRSMEPPMAEVRRVLIVGRDLTDAVAMALQIDYGGAPLRVVAIACSAEEARVQLAEPKPDAVLVIPAQLDADADAFAAELRASAPGTTLVVASDQRPADLVRALSAD